MSKPLTSEQLLRAAWITELRRQGNRQCHNAYRSDGQVCAVGLLIELTGLPATNPRVGWTIFENVARRRAGLSQNQLCEIVQRNDGLSGHRKNTFARIANVVEGWFK